MSSRRPPDTMLKRHRTPPAATLQPRSQDNFRQNFQRGAIDDGIEPELMCGAVGLDNCPGRPEIHASASSTSASTTEALSGHNLKPCSRNIRPQAAGQPACECYLTAAHVHGRIF